MAMRARDRHDPASWNLWRGALDALEWWKTLAALRNDGDNSATLNRFFKSRHVRDLKLIAGMASCVALALALVLLLYEIGLFLTEPPGSKMRPGNWLEALGRFGAAVGAIFGLGGAVIAWVYRTASVRLGVVDLFACEITTLCRVGTIVDWVAQRIAAFETDHGTPAAALPGGGAGDPAASPPAAPASPPYRFISSENYFPVFEGNSQDLQVLEADVVTNVTAFYTYMKVSRDYLRRLGELDARPQPRNLHQEAYQIWCSVIYMQFLAYESARKAIDELIEYEPTHTENTITILLTELVAYSFLRKEFTEGDFRFKRLDLRQEKYREVAKELHAKIVADHSGVSEREREEWERAEALWPELAKRYRDHLGMTIAAIEENGSGRAPVVAAAAA